MAIDILLLQHFIRFHLAVFSSGTANADDLMFESHLSCFCKYRLLPSAIQVIADHLIALIYGNRDYRAKGVGKQPADRFQW